MPLDHFISQVHLRNFYSTDERARLVAVKKDDLKKFYPWSKNVCRNEEGSTNAYLVMPRAIEEFLKRVEPNYNAALAAIRSRKIESHDVYVIAGFTAYIISCSPTAMRMATPHFSTMAEAAIAIMDTQGLIPKAPKELEEKSITDLLAEGSLNINVDGKYPQAIGISQIEERVHTFGNALWDVMVADPADGAFLTSDFPIGFGPSFHQNVVSRTLPLAPDIAICIHPQLRERGSPPDFTFPKFRARFRRLKANEIKEVNRGIARAAESMVFCNRDADWLMTFVRNNRNYRADSVVTKIPTPSGGHMIHARQAIVPYPRPPLS